jgi:hypothetical protein
MAVGYGENSAGHWVVIVDLDAWAFSGQHLMGTQRQALEGFWASDLRGGMWLGQFFGASWCGVECEPL